MLYVIYIKISNIKRYLFHVTSLSILVYVMHDKNSIHIQNQSFRVGTWTWENLAIVSAI